MTRLESLEAQLRDAGDRRDGYLCDQLEAEIEAERQKINDALLTQNALDQPATSVKELRAEIDRLKEREATLTQVIAEKQAFIEESWSKEVVREAFREWQRDQDIGLINAALEAFETEIERIEAGD